MISRIGRLQCDECGKLIGKSDPIAIRWSPWGSGFTPPDEGHLCGKCAGERTPKEVEYHRSAWIPERRINDTANTKPKKWEPVFAPCLTMIALQLQAGSIDPVNAGRQLEAQAQGVREIEERFAKIETAARTAVLNSIGLTASLTELDNAIPRPVNPVDGSAPTSP